jgi:hypothetical protein
VLNLLRDLVSSLSSSVSSCFSLLLLSSHPSSPPSASRSSQRLSSPLIHLLHLRGAGLPYQCSYLPSRPPCSRIPRLPRSITPVACTRSSRSPPVLSASASASSPLPAVVPP